jgi:hypothetical protein
MTAGNSTPLSDGAAALILASPARANDLGVIPLARVVSSAVFGNDPLLMGIAPAWARPLALRRAALTPRTDRRMGNPRGLQRASPRCTTRAAKPTRRIPSSRRQTHPQRRCRGHRASVRRHRRTLCPDPSRRTTRTTSTLRSHRRVHRLRPRRGNDSGKPTSRLTATVPAARPLSGHRSSEKQTARARLICNPSQDKGVAKYSADARPSNWWCQ